jgi:hypothetical protein
MLVVGVGVQAASLAAAPDNTAWLAKAQQELAQREYFVSENDVGLQAPNRAQGFRSYFDDTGVRLVTRDADSESLAELRMVGVGRAEPGAKLQFEALGAAAVVAEQAQISQHWRGLALVQNNQPDGLRQEIHLQQRPVGDGRVTVAIDTGTTSTSAGADQVLLQSAHGSLRWDVLGAEDARGLALSVSVATTGQQLQLSFDDASAQYPIRLKALLTGTADALLASNQAGAQLGASVAGAGDVNGDGFADVIVGASLYDNGQINEGAAFIYFGGAGGFNTNADTVMVSNQASALFGASVASAGDVNGDGFADVIVGAPFFDNGEIEEGAAFVYFGGAGPFEPNFDGRLQSDQVDAELGTSVAGAGDVNGDGFADVIVGARLYDNGQTNEGAAFVYFGGAGAVFNISIDALLQSDQVGAELGTSVAGAGDVNGDGFADVIVGASLFDNGETDEGAAFVYFGGAGAFDTSADAQLQSNQVNAQLGSSVADAGDVNGDGFADVIVGASLYNNGQSDEGAAFVYFGGAGAFNTTADALLESDQVDAYLGHSVASAGDVNGDGFADVIVGAYRYDNGQTDEGAAFVYLGSAGAFNTGADAQLQSNQANARLGWSVAGAGDVNGDGYADVLVGAWFYDNGQTDEGAAFVYFGGAGAFNTSPDAQLESGQADALLGLSVAGAGDVNGDGFADVIVGASFYDNGQTSEGAAFVYFGGAGAFNIVADAQLESDQVNAQLGTSVAGAGDVNGDGYADVIVGAAYFDNDPIQNNEGAAFVYFGGPGAFDPSADAQLESNQADAQLGVSVAGAGDVNGDGFADVIVGASLFDSGQTNEGAAFVYFGGAGTFNTSADALLRSNQANALFGLSVASAGDVNGDGFADVIVGARFYDNAQSDEGAAFVYFGRAGAFDPAADAQLGSGQVNAEQGSSVAGAGDVNGDGFADVIVGAVGYDNGQTDEGAAFIYFGGPGAFNHIADAQLESNQASAFLGNSVAGAGDVNGDGFADVIVGASGYVNGQNEEGAAFLYFGGAGVFNATTDAQLEANQASAFFGNSVAGAGDVNGDGFADVIVGATGYDNGQTDEGAAFVYLGTARGRLVQAEQFRANGSSPVQPWGLSQQADGFVVALNATSPRGRERARLQLEACPSAAPFGSMLCNRFTSSSWTELGADPLGSTLTLAATGLAVDRAYHWRTRVQFADLTGVAPANPGASPWRRLQANADVADIRTNTPASPFIFTNGFE